MFNLSRRTLALVVVLVCASVLLSSTLYAVAGKPYQILTRMRNPIVWQGFGTYLMITEDMPTGRVCYYFDYMNRSKINLKRPQFGNWAPLGSAIKWLMLIDRVDGLDRLMAHDVDGHFIHPARPSFQTQVGCGFVGTDCFYGEYRAAPVGDHYPVDLYRFHLNSGMWEPFCISDSEKSDFAHDGNLLVYHAHDGPGNDCICGQYFTGGDEFTIALANPIHPTVCGPLVAWAEPSGKGFNILAKNIVTGETRTVAWTKANPPCPEAGRGAILWEDARNAKTGLDIYGYDWASKREFVVSNATGDQVRLRVCDNIVTYISGARNYEILWGAKL